MVGRNMEKIVPLCPGRALVRIEIVPSCFCTIPLLTHKPSPVPFSSLVVKKGSKTLPVAAAGIPQPLSAIRMRTPRREGARQSRPGAAGQRRNSVADGEARRDEEKAEVQVPVRHKIVHEWM